MLRYYNFIFFISLFVFWIYKGKEYGRSYTAAGGVKEYSMVFPTLYICGDMASIGIDASIAEFGFYTESFDTEQDAYESCIESGLVNCDGIPTFPTKPPTQTPTLSPVVVCEYGVNYWIIGISGTGSGDPHFSSVLFATIWNNS